MANEQELSQQLQALQDRAEKQHNLAESSRELLHRNLAETYFWWREARNEAGYLDRLYAENNITYRNTGNRYNFSPVVRLAFPRIRTNDATVSYYSKSQLLVRYCMPVGLQLRLREWILEKWTGSQDQ